MQGLSRLLTVLELVENNLGEALALIAENELAFTRCQPEAADLIKLLFQIQEIRAGISDRLNSDKQLLGAAG